MPGIRLTGNGGSNRRRVLIAGAGRTGRRLAERLIGHWSVTLLDISQQRLDLMRPPFQGGGASSGETPLDYQAESLSCLVGDATSRLVLERAGAGMVDCIVAVCGEDVTNLEICRLARQHFDVPQLAAIVRDAELLPQFQALGVQTVLVGTSLAVALANRIEPAVQASEGLGLGHGEVMELTIPASSPVLGQPLRALAPKGWLIAAVYRQGSLIVPHGWTRLQENDRILLVGPPMLLPGIADYLRLGRAQFPYPYGSRLAVILEGPTEDGKAAVREAQLLARQSAAEGLDFLLWGESRRWEQWIKPLATTLDVPPSDVAAMPCFRREAGDLSEQWGCLVIPQQKVGWGRRFGWRRALLDEALEHGGKLVLVARGSFPYRRVVALVQRDRLTSASSASLKSVQAALSLGNALKLEVHALTVTAPAFIAGEAVASARQEIDQSIQTLAAAYRMRIERQHLTGNPIREVLTRLEWHDLLVVRGPRRIQPSLLRPDVGRYLALHVPCSVLFIPDE